MDPIKEAFLKIKQDILSIKNEINEIKTQISTIQTIPTQNIVKTSQQTDTPTHTHTNTPQSPSIESKYPQNTEFSTGNRGVPTNQQTHTPTHQQTNSYTQNTPISEFKQANDILSSLDTIKKGIRLKFKRLTPQEMLVFSTLYTLEEQKTEEITYRAIATQLNLSESSIRDYINKLTKKGVPIEKIRQNNKTILLKISQDLKNVTTLATIQNLREL